jgi:hypothetical protein
MELSRKGEQTLVVDFQGILIPSNDVTRVRSRTLDARHGSDQR